MRVIGAGEMRIANTPATLRHALQHDRALFASRPGLFGLTSSVFIAAPKKTFFSCCNPLMSPRYKSARRSAKTHIEYPADEDGMLGAWRAARFVHLGNSYYHSLRAQVTPKGLYLRVPRWLPMPFHKSILLPWTVLRRVDDRPLWKSGGILEVTVTTSRGPVRIHFDGKLAKELVEDYLTPTRISTEESGSASQFQADN
jgi:hypothetical protein